MNYTSENECNNCGYTLDVTARRLGTAAEIAANYAIDKMRFNL